MVVRHPPAPRVHIHYLRPPARVTVYRQDLIEDNAHVKITLSRKMALPAPLQVGEQTLLEAGSDVVWFTYPGLWHDVGRFHRADGHFTGIYANILTPCVFDSRHDWHTTDLFLDLWIPAEGGPPCLLDEDELIAAEEQGILEPRLASQARREAEALMTAWAEGRWPAPEVRSWTRERALAAQATQLS